MNGCEELHGKRWKEVVKKILTVIPELTDDSSIGYTVPPKDIKALSNAIINAGKHLGKVIEMGLKVERKPLNY